MSIFNFAIEGLLQFCNSVLGKIPIALLVFSVGSGVAENFKVGNHYRSVNSRVSSSAMTPTSIAGSFTIAIAVIRPPSDS
jgi:hypothetical protein